jgi:hypothetical protein
MNTFTLGIGGPRTRATRAMTLVMAQVIREQFFNSWPIKYQPNKGVQVKGGNVALARITSVCRSRTASLVWTLESLHPTQRGSQAECRP